MQRSPIVVRERAQVLVIVHAAVDGLLQLGRERFRFRLLLLLLGRRVLRRTLPTDPFARGGVVVKAGPFLAAYMRGGQFLSHEPEKREECLQVRARFGRVVPFEHPLGKLDPDMFAPPSHDLDRHREQLFTLDQERRPPRLFPNKVKQESQLFVAHLGRVEVVEPGRSARVAQPRVGRDGLLRVPDQERVVDVRLEEFGSRDPRRVVGSRHGVVAERGGDRPFGFVQVHQVLRHVCVPDRGEKSVRSLRRRAEMAIIRLDRCV